MSLPIRKNIRLKTYDYTTAGGYFVTICTDGKRCLLSRIENIGEATTAAIRLTKLGQIAQNTLLEIEKRYPIRIDAYVLMPNHIHMIILADNVLPATLGQIIGAYKSLTAKHWREYCCSQNMTAGHIWQRNYYEHILRNEADYLEKARYIDENPDKWVFDEHYAEV